MRRSPLKRGKPREAKSDGLKRGKPLARRAGLARRALSRAVGPPAANPAPRPTRKPREVERAVERLRARQAEPGYEAWHRPHRGLCAVCRHPDWLVRHHVVLEQVVRRYGGNPWDQRNALELGSVCDCHEGHHTPGVRDTRLDYAHVPEDAIDFAYALMGAAAADYFRRRYRNAPLPEEALDVGH